MLRMHLKWEAAVVSCVLSTCLVLDSTTCMYVRAYPVSSQGMSWMSSLTIAGAYTCVACLRGGTACTYVHYIHWGWCKGPVWLGRDMCNHHLTSLASSSF